MKNEHNTDPLIALGYRPFFEEAFAASPWAHFEPARILADRGEQYEVAGRFGAVRAEPTGRYRRQMEQEEDRPTVGDWVVVAPQTDAPALLHHRLPRQTVLLRRAATRETGRQAIGANLDTAFIVQSADKDFNVNRLERYLAAVHEGGITPVMVVNKTDLLEPGELDALVAEVRARHPDLPLVPATNRAADGLDGLRPYLRPGDTCCFIGSSGVGKSTLVNALLGKEVLETGAISDWNQRGRHTTSHRALLPFPNGCLLMDTPGMRELGLTSTGAGLDRAFEDIAALAAECRFSDCRHEGEPGCAVLAAMDAGTLTPEKFENYLKVRREAAHFEQSARERRRLARSRGKEIKRILREKYDGRG